MKILVVGVFNENSTNNGIANGFENAGHEVIRFDYREKIKTHGLEPTNQQIIIFSQCVEHYPNLIFFCKCNGIDHRVLPACGEMGKGKTFLWYMDPLNGNFNLDLLAKAKVADYVGVAKWEVYEEMQRFNDNTHFLIEGFDSNWDYPIETKKKYDVSFIGNSYGDRVEWLDYVKATILSNKYNTKHSEAVGESRINLNFTGGGGPSDRVYKILAAGGFLLSQEYPHCEKYGLIPDKDFVTFSDKKEMVEKIAYYLAHRDLREKIASQGLKTVQKFSRDNLAKQIIDIVK